VDVQQYCAKSKIRKELGPASCGVCNDGILKEAMNKSLIFFLYSAISLSMIGPTIRLTALLHE
jgi:hypothetical protein